jgi:hypothetical protein
MYSIPLNATGCLLVIAKMVVLPPGGSFTRWQYDTDSQNE